VMFHWDWKIDYCPTNIQNPFWPLERKVFRRIREASL
jgi:hypothetical protein